ncbi:MAG TPA: hypothetical protein VHW90_07010 [Stellaceae bacterium]|jgi:hypothetical protein|nr:hypothetical protein [Stellaceae bacterium]
MLDGLRLLRMRNADNQLAAIGFSLVRREPVCWRTERLDRPAPQTDDSEAALPCSADLLRWRDLLARRPLPSGYRISRI